MSTVTKIHRHDCPFSGDSTCTLSEGHHGCYEHRNYSGSGGYYASDDYLAEKDCPLQKLRVVYEVVGNRVIQRIIRKRNRTNKSN